MTNYRYIDTSELNLCVALFQHDLMMTISHDPDSNSQDSSRSSNPYAGGQHEYYISCNASDFIDNVTHVYSFNEIYSFYFEIK